ncbi:unnamed protein product, partial [Thlaspi arvense]
MPIEEPEHFRSLYRMYPTSFEKLCDLIRTKTSLKDTRNICVEEMVATFLLTIGQSSKYCYTIDTFKRSVFATSENFHKASLLLSKESMLIIGEMIASKMWADAVGTGSQ